VKPREPSWLLANHRALVGAEFGLNEGGGGLSRAGRRIANCVQASEKVYVDCTLEVTNKGATARSRSWRMRSTSWQTRSRVLAAGPSPPSPLTAEIMQAITRVTEEMWPGVPAIPFMSTGATDGLYFRQAGIPIYGVSGLFGDMDDVRAHGRDERMGVKEFFDGQEFLWWLVGALTR
jgi:acetylornithine deacetylase/succinyl-diaminopimelate desuccinylase-like protein